MNRLRQQGLDIRREGAPDLQMEALRAGPPQYDLGLVEHGPRTGTRGKGADRQVQRTTARQPDFGLRAVQRDRDLPVTDVNARSTEGGQSLAGDRKSKRLNSSH